MDRPVIGVGTLNVSARAKALVAEALDNNRLSYGPMTQEFERRFARLHECRFGIMSNSGTSALHIAVAAMKEMHGFAPGDEVIVPAVTFVATANVVLHNGLTPVFVDVEPLTYGLDPALLESKITPRTRAIIPVHLFGQPCDMDPILDVARRNNLKVIEDSCETMFARNHGRSVGSLGDIGCFSTYVAHLLVTGVGGLNTTNDPDYAVILRSLMNHGRDSIYISIDDDEDKSAEEMRLIIARRFRFVHLGHSFRCTEMEAALGLGQLDGWEAMIARRRSNAAFLSRSLSRFEDRLQVPTVRPGAEHSFMMYPLVLRDRKKDELVNYLEQYGIETRDMLPLTNQPIYRDLLGTREEDFPVAKWINESGFYVGCHQDLSDADLDYIVEVFDRFWSAELVRPRAGAALIIVTRNDLEALRNAVDTLPFAAFDRVLALNSGGPVGGEAENLLRQRNVTCVSLDGEDPLLFLSRHAISRECDRLVVFTADGRQSPEDASRLLLALDRGHDMVIASRFLAGGRRHDAEHRLQHRSVGNRVFTLLANLVFAGNYTDVVNPFRAIRSRRLREIGLERSGVLGAYDLSIAALQWGWKVTEVPTAERIGPTRSDRRQAWFSVLPMLHLLWSKWRKPRPRNSPEGDRP